MRNMKKFVKVLFAMIVAVMLGTTQPVEAASDTVVIYEVYGGGGNSGATFKNDYVVLKNVSTQDQSLDGLYVHRASDASWYEKVALKGTIKAGEYYVIQASEGNNVNAKALPRKEIEAKNMTIAAKSFSIALTSDSKTPSSTNIIDLVGVGTAINNEVKPTKSGDNSISLRRISDIDTDNNYNDFKQIFHNDSSLDYLKKSDKIDESELEVIPEESVVTIDPNGGEISGLQESTVVKSGESYTFPWAAKYYKDGYHFDGFDVEGNLEDSNGNKVTYIQSGHANPIYSYAPKSDVTLKVRWKEMQAGQFIAHLSREDGKDFDYYRYKLSIEGTKTEKKDLIGTNKVTSNKYKLSALQLKDDTYTLRVDGLNANESIASVTFNPGKYNTDQAEVTVKEVDKDTALVTIKYNSKYIAPEANFDVVIKEEENAPVVTERNGLVIYEVYGGGGESGSYYNNDYIVIKNTSDTAIDLAGYQVQRLYSSETRPIAAVNLSGTLESGAYYVISGASGTQSRSDRVALPRVDQATDINLSITNNVLRIVDANGDVVDLAGFGNGQFYETQVSKAMAKDASARRINEGQDTNNNSVDFASIQHTRGAEVGPLSYLPVEATTYNVTFDADPADVEGVTLPENTQVNEGETYTLPVVEKKIKLDSKSYYDYVFKGFALNGDKENLKQTNEEIQINEDTKITLVYDKEYRKGGSVSVEFHYGEYSDEIKNGKAAKDQRLSREELAGFGFTVKSKNTDEVIESKLSTTYPDQPYFITGNAVLTVDDYVLNLTIPKGYELVKVKRLHGTHNQVYENVPVEFSYPRSTSLTTGESFKVEVRKKEAQKVNVTYKSNKLVTDLDLPEAQQVEAGSRIKLPDIAKTMKSGQGLDKFEYYLVNGEQKLPGDEIVVNEDTEITAVYQFYNYRYSASIYLADENGMPGTKLKDASGFVVKAGDVESVQSKNYPSNLNVGPLLPGTYDISVEIPEGYELVNILDYDNNPVTSETRPVGAESTTTSRILKVVVREKAPEVKLPEDLYIYEIYGGGGLQKSYYANDYIVLQNKSNNDISLDGMYLHISDQWRNDYKYLEELKGTIKANDYFVIKAGKTFQSGLEKDLPRFEYEITPDIDYQGIGVALTMGRDVPNESNTIDLVGTYNKNRYLVTPASSPYTTTSIRRVAYDDVNKTDFVKVEHEDYSNGKVTEPEPLWYLVPDSEKVTVTFEFNKTVEGVEVPKPIKVKKGSIIKLPEVSNKYTDKLSFLGWKVKTDSIPKADHNQGEEITVNEDMTIKGMWGYNDGRVFAIFHEKTYAGTYPNNEAKIDKVKNLDGFGLKVTHNELNKTTEGEKAKYEDSLVAGKLQPGQYTLNVTVPEGYEIVRIVRARAVDNNNPENAQTIENGSTVSIPDLEDPFNISASPRLYVEVRKVEVKPTEYKVTLNPNGGTVTDDYATKIVRVGDLYELPNPFAKTLQKDGYVIESYSVEEGILLDAKGNKVKEITNIYDRKYTPQSDVTIKVNWKKTEGMLDLHLVVDGMTSQQQFDYYKNTNKIRLVDENGKEYLAKLGGNGSYYDAQKVVWRFDNLPSGKYNLVIENLNGEIEKVEKIYSGDEVVSHTLADGKVSFDFQFVGTSSASNIVRYAVNTKLPAKTTKIVNFVVDPERGTATGSLFAKVAEGEDPLNVAPEVTGINGYTFKDWQKSDDDLTYTAVFNDPEPKGPVINNNYTLKLKDFDSSENVINIITNMSDFKAVIKANGREIDNTLVPAEGFYKIRLNENLGNKTIVEIYLVNGNERTKSAKFIIRK